RSVRGRRGWPDRLLVVHLGREAVAGDLGRHQGPLPSTPRPSGSRRRCRPAWPGWPTGRTATAASSSWWSRRTRRAGSASSSTTTSPPEARVARGELGRQWAVKRQREPTNCSAVAPCRACARNPFTGLARSGPIAEWHLVLGNAFRHLAFHFGAGLGQPAVVVAPPLFHARLVPVGAVADPVGGDGIQQGVGQAPPAGGVLVGSSFPPQAGTIYDFPPP